MLGGANKACHYFQTKVLHDCSNSKREITSEDATLSSDLCGGRISNPLILMRHLRKKDERPIIAIVKNGCYNDGQVILINIYNSRGITSL